MNAELLEPWRPSLGAWDRAAIQHLFRRAGFGARPAELELALATGLEATLERLFEDHGAPELRGAVAALLPAGDLELLQAWWMGLILEGGAPLRERMTLVWHDHFATSNDKVDDVRLMHAQNELFRERGLGDFRELLRAVARDPAMLLWLDGDSNRRGQPNENFAREVLELFALGIGNYTEADVREAARAFTGWGTSGRSFVLRADQHDDGEKTLFGRTARLDGDEALACVLAQPACARHVARTLLEAFVAPDPPDASVAAVARALLEHEWNIGRTLRVLFGSRLFFAPEARRSRIAGPVELVAVAARTSGARVAPLRAARMCAEMGQALFRPPSVKGWDGGRSWIHSGSWIARHNALVELVEAGGGEDRERWLEETFAGMEREGLAERALQRLLFDGAGDALRARLEHGVRSTSTLAQARATAVALALTSPEFQLF